MSGTRRLLRVDSIFGDALMLKRMARVLALTGAVWLVPGAASGQMT